MKRIFYFAAAAFAACAVMVSCDKDDDKKPNNPPTPDPDQPTKLATPSVTCEVGETEVTVSWEAVANAASYEYTVDGGTATTTEETTFTLAVADLAAGNHTVSVTALPEDGSEEYTKSDAGTATFNIEESTEPVEPTAELAEWLGTYTVNATRQVELYEGAQYVEMRMVEEPESFEITIEPSTDANFVFVYGFSRVDASIPAWATLFSDKESGEIIGLGLLAESYPVGEVQGSQLAYYGIFEDKTDGNGVGIVSGLQYTFIFQNDGSSITSVPADVYFSDTQENPYYVVATDVMSASGQQLSLWYNEYPVRLPAGEFTLTKTDTSAPANVFARDIRTLGASSFAPLAGVSIVR